VRRGFAFAGRSRDTRSVTESQRSNPVSRLTFAVVALFCLSVAGEEPLVTRGGVDLNLGGAETILDGAKAKAREMKLKMNIAVVDDGGHLVAFVRMDGARPASVNTAITKAISAATFRQATGPVPAGTKEPDVLLNLSLQNAAAAGGGRLTTLYGGVPIELDGQIIGAVGCGGGTGAQDAEVARAGIAKLLEAIKKGEAGGERSGE
jgi:glc operon protein GlcG